MFHQFCLLFLLATIHLTFVGSTCEIPEVPVNFKCSKTGRFSNPNDITCASYYICSLRSGKYITTPYSCPKGSLFDPKLLSCSKNYACTCQKASTSTSTTTTTTTPRISTTESAPACEVPKNPVKQDCNTKGRFQDLNDPYCTSYYLCSALKNGSYIRTPYNCPTSSFYDPKLQACSKNYHCSCSKTPTKTTPVTTTSTRTTTLPSTSTTTTNPCEVPQVPIHFKCEAKGRFQNPNDPFCTSYFSCSQLKNGTYLKTPYSCPSGAFFDPSSFICNVHYKCACLLATTEIPSSTTSVEDSTTTTEKLTTTTQEDTTTVEDVSTTTNPCEVPKVPVNFECTIKGRFPNLNDPYCHSYFLCNRLRNGTYIKTPYKCPSGSFFDPSIHICNVKYECGCSVPTTAVPTSTTPVISTTEEESTTELSSTTSTTVSSTTEEDSTTELSSTTTTPASSTTEELTSTTQEDTTTEEDVSTTTNPCEVPKVPINFKCTAKGRYPNLNDPYCHSYFLCNRLRNGTYIQTPYKCPSGSFFDPSIHICNVKYECGCSIPTTEVPTSTTPVLSTTEEETTTELSSTTSTTVSSTTEEDSTTELSSTTTTPASSTTEELTSTTQEDTTTEEDVNTTTNPCEVPKVPINFKCTTKGRFPNLNDPYCHSYFLCNRLRNGTYIQTPYKCPSGSFFDPSIHICNVKYECGCSVPTTEVHTSTTPVISTTQEETTTELSSTTSTPVSSTTEELTSTTQEDTTTEEDISTTTNPCEVPKVPINFKCTTKGRFPNLNDPYCHSYFLCNRLRNGTYIQTPYKCPSGSFFDPSIHICNVKYECGCSVPITEVPTSTTPVISTTEEETTTELSSTTSTTVSSTTEEDSTTELSSTTTTTASSTTEELTSTTQDDTTTEDVSTTTNPCEVPKVPINFKCTTKGRFPNLNDPYCHSYFLCNRLRNGTYIQTPYKCPSGSFFDPSIHICNVKYECGCSEPTTEVPTSTTPVISTTQEETTTELSSTRSTTVSSTTEDSTIEISSTTTTTASSTTEELTSTTQDDTTTEDVSTTTNPCEVPKVPINFKCTTKGRFPNLNDPYCHSYFLCNRLRNGTYIQTPYKCPSGSFFDPSIHICNVKYECGCSEPTTKVPTSTTPVISTTQEETTTELRSTTSTTVSSTTEEDSTTELTSTTTTPASSTTEELTSTAGEDTTTEEDVSTTTNPCEVPKVPINFKCTAEGHFPNLNDPYCHSYFLCNRLRNGTYIQTPYKCPSGSFFDPSIHICNVKYECGCSLTTTEVPTSTTPVISTTEGETTTELSSTTSTTVSSTTEENSTTELSSTTTTPASSTTEKLYSTTQEDTTTEEDISTTTNPCEVPKVPINFKCTAKGRFPNLNDPYCHSYFLCNRLRNGTYIQTPYKCPSGSFFDPSIHICNVKYECGCSEPTTKVPTSTTPVMSTTEEETTTEFSSTTSTTVSSTTEEDSTTELSSTTTTPASSTTEELTSTTQEDTTTEDISTTTNPCEVPKVPINFKCTTKGRFPNLNDPYCHSYFLCNRLRNGTYIQTPYKCPSGSFFDPSIHICNVKYECGCSEPTTEVSTSTTPVISTTEEETTTELSSTTSTTASSTTEEDSTTELSSTTTTTASITTEELTSTTQDDTTTEDVSTTTNPCEVPKVPINFKCTTKGRFPNLNDPYCHSYFLCNRLRNGTYIQTPYKCPSGSFFDPSIHICNVKYECGCSEPTTEVPTSTTPVISTTEEETTTELSSTTSTTVSSTTEEDSTTELSSTTTTTASITTEELTSTTQDDTTTEDVSTTTNPCEVPKVPINFKCTTKGRFPNLNDPYCHSYFLCNRLRNGTYIQTPYKCPSGSFFDPSIHICNVKYECGCSEPTTEVSTSTTPVISTTEEETTTELSSTTSTTASSTTEEDSTTELSSTTTTTASITTEELTSTTQDDTTTEDVSTTTNPCEVPKVPINFKCTTKGRFPNLNDPYCHSYFLCNRLRNGTYIQTPYKCPSGSFFDPSIHICNVKYECGCSEPTTEVPTSTTPVISTTEEETTTELSSTTSTTVSSTTEEDSTTELSSTTTTTASITTEELTSTTQDDTTTEDVSTTTNPCEVPKVPINFKCTTKGRFPNLNDPYCHSYFLCNRLRNGTYIQTPYKCPSGSFFDPSIHICNVKYECGCSEPTTEVSTSTTPVISTTEEETTTELSSTTSTTASSTTEEDSTTELSSTTTTTASITTEELTSTTQDDTTTEDVSTTTNPCEVPKVPINFKCTTKGRFPNLNDPYCHSYFLCNRLRNGTYIQTPYKCPSGSFFDPSIHICNVKYECGCSEPTTEVPTSTTPVISTTEEETTTELSSTTSTTVSSTTEEDSTTELSSTTTTTASITTEELTSTTQDDTTTEDVSTTTNPCEVPKVPINFKCTTKGRFPNLNDPYCHSYFLCNRLRNGTYIQTPYKCPSGSFFDPSIHICNVKYECGCSEPTTEVSTSTTPVISTTEEETTTELSSTTSTTASSTTEEDSTTELSSTTTTTASITTEELTSTTQDDTTTEDVSTTTNPCEVPKVPINFKCTTKGRFPNLNDPYCHSYFLCNRLRNGTYIQTPYKCPSGSFFDPSIHICNVKYECGCSEPTTEVPTSTTPVISTTQEETTTELSSTTSTTVSSTTEEDSTTELSSTTTTPAASTTEELTSTTQEDTTTEDISTTTNPCAVPKVPINFKCTTKGRFQNLNDPFCTSYFLCSQLRNGTYEKTPSKCPSGSYFDPKMLLCSNKYECDCKEGSTSSTTKNSEITPDGKSVITTSTTKKPSTTTKKPSTTTTKKPTTTTQKSTPSTTTKKPSTTTTKKPTTTTRKPTTKKPSTTTKKPTTTTKKTTTTTKKPCVAPKNPTAFVCTKSGRFTDPNNPFCSSYYLCSLLRGSMVTTKYDCPTGSVFDPKKKICSKNYACACKK